MNNMVAKNMDWIMWKAMMITSSRQDAEELASETIYRCLVHADKYDRRRPFKPWVTAVMSNALKSINTIKSRMRFSDIGECRAMTSVEDASQMLITRKMLDKIRHCARKSCCVESAIMFAKGFSYEEISQATGVRLNTVKSRIAAGRQFIRQAIF